MAGRVWPARDASVTYTYISYSRVIVHISLFLELANMYDKFPYLTAPKSPIFSVWDYVPTRFYSAGDVDARRASDLITDGYDRVDPSPRDHQSSTCANTHLSDVDRKAYRSPRGDRRRAYLHQHSDRAIAIQRPREVGFLLLFGRYPERQILI